MTRQWGEGVQHEGWTVRESRRRKRTMTAFREQGHIVVVVPAHMSEQSRRTHVPALVESFLAREARRSAPRGEQELTARASALFTRYVTPVTGVSAPPLGVRWVDTMARRWASCTVTTGEIRVSDRLLTMPGWVLDYVLVHEVTHLVEHDHSPRFWEIVHGYPDAWRARGFLEGVEHAAGRPS